MAKRLWSLLVGAIFVAASGTALASGDQELDVARTRLEAGQYAEAVERFLRLLDPSAERCPDGPTLTPKGCRLVEAELALAARGYLVVALVALDRTPEARAEVEKILRESPNYNPSPSIFPQQALDLFTEAKGRLADELAAILRKRAAEDFARDQAQSERDKAKEQYIRDLERLARQERVVVSQRSRWIAMIPFGVGQFQNDNVGLGLTFGLTQAAAGAGTIVTTALYQDLVSRAARAKNPNTVLDGYLSALKLAETNSLDEKELNRRLEVIQVVNVVSFGVFALSAVAGIIEAQASFVDDESPSRSRQIPKRPAVRLTPGPVVTAGIGAGVGIEVSF